MSMASDALVNRAYRAGFWKGLADRCAMQEAYDVFGEDSTEASQAHAQHSACLHLAQQSLDEVPHELNRASWQGYLDGSRRFAAVGGAKLPFDFVRDADQQDALRLVYEEINGWMLEFARDLPWCVEMIKNGARSIAPTDVHIETWSFFETLTRGLDDTSGNFGDGFTDEDRKIINEFVKGDWERAAELVERGWLKGEGRP